MSDARALLRDAGLRPKRSFGQNFLVNDGVLVAIAKACVRDGEIGRARVLELGAGLGALTRLLVERARHVVAVERDRDLVPILTRELEAARSADRLRVLEADAQAVEIAGTFGGYEEGSPRVLCGNLPYQITGRLLQRAVEAAGQIERVVFMVQDEVAERLVASPGTKDYGALTVFVRAAFNVSRLMKVSAGSFHPPPDVTSSIVILVPHRPARAAEETPLFRAVVKGAFGARRKTLRNAWASVAPQAQIARAAEAASISLDARGETLSVEDFSRMTAALEELGHAIAPASKPAEGENDEPNTPPEPDR